MAVAINTANDWKLVEGRETISYFSKDAEKPSDSGQTVKEAKRFPIRKDRLTGDSLLAKMDITWRVWKNQLGGIVPKIGDILADADGARWIVKMVEVLSFGQSFRLSCMQSKKVVS